MALQTSGAISLNQIHVEAGGASGTQVSLNDSDIRGLISKASGASMSFNEWYGASSLNITLVPAQTAGSYGYSIDLAGKLVKLEPDGVEVNNNFSSVAVRFSSAQAVTITGTSFSEFRYDIGKLYVDGTLRIEVSGDGASASPPASSSGSWSGTIPAGGIVKATYEKDASISVGYDDADFRITWT